MHAPAHTTRSLTDELGTRVLETGPGGELLETLSVARALAGHAEFRRALVVRVRSLEAAPGPSVARIVNLEAPDNDPTRLLVQSEFPRGERLSCLVGRINGERRPLTLGQVCYLLRGAVAAVRGLHASGPGVCHGAIAASRFVLATNGRVVLLDYAFGSALAGLGWPPDRLRDELGLVVPGLPGIPPFTPLTDQLQLGLLALQLAAGCPGRADSVAAMAGRLEDGRLPVADGTLAPLPAEFSTAVRRALLLSPEGPFRSLAALERALDAVASTLGGAVEPPEIAVEEWPGPWEEPCGTHQAMPDRASTGVSPPAAPVRPPAADGPSTVVEDVRPQVRPWWEPRGTCSDAQPASLESSVSGAACARPGDLAAPLGPGSSGQSALGTGPALLHSERDRPQAGAVEGDTSTPPGRGAPAASPGPTPPRPDTSPPHPTGGAPEAKPPAPSDGPGQWHPTKLRLQAPREPEGAEFDAGGADFLGRPASALFAEPQPRVRPWPRIVAIGLAAIGVLASLAYYLGAGEALQAWRKPPRGHLRLESKPAGATVMVDGIERGRTPISLAMPPGSYRVEFWLDAESKAMTVPVDEGNETYQLVSLYPPGPPGTLQISSAPTGAAVSVDGEPRGHTPLTLADVPPGEHVVVAASAVAKVERTVEVMAGAVVPVVLPLAGAIEIRAPFEVTIYDRATTVGTGRVGRFPLPAGRRRLTLVNEELQYEEDRSVDVPAGGVVHVDVTPPTGVLNFTADTETEVFLDNRPLGTTPLGNVSVSLGPHEVLYRHQKWGEQRYTILVSLGSPARLHAVMESKKITVTRRPPPPRPPRVR